MLDKNQNLVCFKLLITNFFLGWFIGPFPCDQGGKTSLYHGTCEKIKTYPQTPQGGLLNSLHFGKSPLGDLGVDIKRRAYSIALWDGGKKNKRQCLSIHDSFS